PHLTTLVSDARDLAHRIGLAVDREQGRGLGKIDGAHHALDLRVDADGIARGVGCRCCERVLAIGPLRAVIALAVPGEGLVVAGAYRITAGIDSLPGTVGDRDVQVAVAGNIEIPGR